MTESDEQELHRLTDILRDVEGLAVNEGQSEAIKKAALALHSSFINGGRSQIESTFENLGKPLNSEQRAFVDSLLSDNLTED